uniref:Putative reverse transcriptase, RNA-dependent DNA polymerase n=1 Tax=Tanacetum cinerariifolium TaxID=118510 RepID=A0A699IFN7_TANCI|nr:putative reverse transcriptase, RNA-dependent DNA polymerase [Tanacetum cinerariifolium]
MINLTLNVNNVACRGTQKNNASVLSVYLDWWTDGNKKGTKSAKTEKEKVPTTNTSSINKENTSDGQQSDGGFRGIATTVNKGIGGNFSVAECPPSVNGSAHMAQSSFKKPSGPWIFDCGATDTMTHEVSDFTEISKPRKTHIQAANRERMDVKTEGMIEISPSIKLPNCLYDIRTRRIIGRGTEREGLYYVNEVTTSGTMMIAHGTSEREAWLWHRRLGHPSLKATDKPLNLPILELNGHGEEQCDTLSWLRYTSEESCPNQNTTSVGAQEQSSPNISAIEDTIPNLISEEHEEPTLTEVEEPTLIEVPKKYVLPSRQRGDRVTCLIIYVDDMIITENDKSEIKKLKEGLCAKFKMKDLGNLRYFLGIEVTRSPKGIFICQKKYILDLLVEIGMIYCKPAETPMITNQKLLMKIKAKLANRDRYQRMVGKLIYLSHTRPDISYAIGVAGDKGNKRSTSRYFSLVGGNLVTWKSKKQKVVSLSSAKAEFRGIAKGLAEALWIRKFVSEIGFPPKESIRIMSNNKSSIQILENPVQHDRTKHVEVD